MSDSPTPSRARSRLMLVGIFAVGAVLGAGALRAVDVVTSGDDPSDYTDGDISLSQTVEGDPTTFRIASLNVLGAGHTDGPGGRGKYADGEIRMKMQVNALRAQDIDVVGFQELQPPQYRMFRERAGTEYTMWPGNIEGRGFLRNSIAWRKADWTLVDTSWIKLPYFRGEQLRMPVVKLANNLTGQEMYFINFQNPANARGDAERWRDQGRNLQIALVNRLRRDTRLPVFWTGDLNEREDAFCDVTARTDLKSASGGVNSKSCAPRTPMWVDWVFGSAEVTFSQYVADRSRRVARSTDHPMIVATATVPATKAVVCTVPVDPPEEPT